MKTTPIQEISLTTGILTGGLSQTVAMSTTSAQSTAITADLVVVAVDAACFVRAGANPTAVSDGTDHYLPIGAWRIPFISGQKLAFKMASGTGNAYITPGA